MNLPAWMPVSGLLMLTHTIRLLVVLPFVVTSAFAAIIQGTVRDTARQPIAGVSTVAACDGKWNSTDQVPERAVDDGDISRFGAIDPSDGGTSHRYSAAGDWQRSGDNTLTKASAYGIGYGLNLFSNFTYYLDNPVNGDQFEQADRRIVAGGRTTHRWFSSLFGRQSENVAGIEVRHDDIGNIDLYHTHQRQRLETIRRLRFRATF